MTSRFLASALQLAAVIGLLLAGWGIVGWRGFFLNSARASLLAVAACGALIGFLLQLDFYPLRRGTCALGRQSLELLTLALAALFLVLFLPFADRRGILKLSAHQPVRYVGLLLLGAGMLVRLTAMRQLGRYFSAYVTLQDGHQLIQSGVYGIIRHPLYLSLLLAAPGFALVFASALFAPILAGTVVFVSLRMAAEEHLLELRFEQGFAEYRKRTWALIPLIF